MVVSVTTVGLVGTVATALMVAAMLAMVWLAMDDEYHRPSEQGADADAVADD